nr:Myb/SANT-like DNA-binding domain [Nuttalliella namaqua]
MAGRASYISDEEKNVLIELVGKYKTIIENKKSDAVSLNAKNKAWQKLSTEYNSVHGVRPRDVKQLRKTWDNLKTKWKKEQAKEKRCRMATGTYCYIFIIRESELEVCLDYTLYDTSMFLTFVYS